VTNADDVLKKLFIDETDTLKELEKLVDSASKVFRIERPSGRVVFRDFKNLTDKQRIAAYLSAKYFATKSQIITNYDFGIGDIAKELGRPATSLSGPIRQLVDEGFVESLPDKKYSIVYHRLTEVFETILSLTK
jgi:hypothetical protein